MSDAPAPAAPTAADEPSAAPGPPKPAGFPGRYVVLFVVIGSLLITAGFTAVKLVKGDPDVQNKARRAYTDGLGALERIVRCRVELEKQTAAGQAGKIIELQKRELAEWEIAELAFAESISTGIVRRPAVGWLAEVKRRDGDLTTAERLFNQALGDGPPPQTLRVDSLIGFEGQPDPADLGGRALVRAALNNDAQAAADARDALALYAADAPTRAGDVWAEFAPEVARLEEIAAAAE